MTLDEAMESLQYVPGQAVEPNRFFARLQLVDDWCPDGLQSTVGGVVTITATYDPENVRYRFTFTPDAAGHYRPTSLDALPS